jgi:hypothetical protein
MKSSDDRFSEYYARLDAAKEQERALAVRQYYNSPIVGVVVPLLQATVTGLLLALVVGLTMLAVGGFSARQILTWSAVVLAVVAFFYWTRLIARWLHLVHSFERMTGVDLNRDGYVGDPGQQHAVIYVVTNNGHQTRSDFPVSFDKMKEVAAVLVENGFRYSERELTGAKKPLTLKEFDDLRDELVLKNWVVWKNPEYPQQGVTFTADGQQAMTSYHNNLEIVKEDR